MTAFAPGLPQERSVDAVENWTTPVRPAPSGWAPTMSIRVSALSKP
jgi:hypothetical protein